MKAGIKLSKLHKPLNNILRCAKCVKAFGAFLLCKTNKYLEIEINIVTDV